MTDFDTRIAALEERVKRAEWETEELRTSLLALARYLLTPGECLVPDTAMYCGGCDLCPCRTEGHFHGTCNVNEELVQLLNEHIDKNPAPWRHHKANQTKKETEQ